MLLGCNKLGNDETSRLDAANARSGVQRLEERISSLEESRRLDDILSRNSITLTPSDPGFATVQANVGMLTVALTDVSGFADGSRIRLEVGNPLAAGISNLRAHITYGSADRERNPIGRSYSTQHQFPGALEGGTRRTFTVNLAGVPPRALGYVRVSIVNASTISMATR